MTAIHFDSQFKKALEALMDSSQNVFLTGNAGTGKSTLLSYFIEKYKKKAVVLAPTGVAALNVQGETIHSFFHFQPAVTFDEAKKISKRMKKKQIYKNIDTLIIDEISMVRADLLDCMDIFLKTVLENKRPFGGVRMIFVGDLYQLPPVVTKQEKIGFDALYKSPYFFSAKIMQEGSFKLSYIELEKIYRQTDERFISILNHVRKNTIDDEDLSLFNERVMPEDFIDDQKSLHLVTTNTKADEINALKLSNLSGKSYGFEAYIEGEFDKRSSPTSFFLELKKDAQIMFLTNHPQGLWVNGSIGTISQIEDDYLLVELEHGTLVEVERYEWSLYQYQFDSQTKSLSKKTIGLFEQFPLRLAWAITIHKSQGKTFDKVILDLERGTFAHGQAYVGLSRCRSFENLILKKPLKKSHIRMDYKVAKFLTEFQYALSNQRCTHEEKVQVILKAIEKKQLLNITYLKANDIKSKRTILPIFYGEMTYQNKNFLALQAFCKKREEKRVFKIERILDIQLAKD